MMPVEQQHAAPTRWLKVEDLVPYPRNPRLHPPLQIEALKSALSRFGLVSPLTVQAGNNYVLGGNGRLEAIRALGWKTVECKVVTVSDAEALLVNAGLNQLGEMSTWDETLLTENLLEGLSQISVDPIAIGFEQGDLDRLSESLEKHAKHEEDKIQVSEHDRDKPMTESDEELAVASIAKPGDVWNLGSHKLYVGAMTDNAFAELAESFKADTLWCMLPEGEWSIAPEGGQLHEYKERCDFSFVCCDWGQLENAQRWDEHTRAKHIIWDQGTRAPQGVGYVSRHRIVLFYGHLARAGLCDVWQISRDAKTDHTPVPLIAKAFSDVASRRALDPYARKGSSIVAAEHLGVQMLCAEHDPDEADYIIARWERQSGKKAAKANKVKSRK